MEPLGRTTKKVEMIPAFYQAIWTGFIIYIPVVKRFYETDTYSRETVDINFKVMTNEVGYIYSIR